MHQDLQLPPLFPLMEIIPLKYFFPETLGLHFIKRIKLLLYLESKKPFREKKVPWTNFYIIQTIYFTKLNSCTWNFMYKTQTSGTIPIRIHLTGFIMWKGYKAIKNLKWLLGIILFCGCKHDLQLCIFCPCFFSLVLNYKWTTGSWHSSSSWKTKLTCLRDIFLTHFINEFFIRKCFIWRKKTPTDLKPSSFALKRRVKIARCKTRPNNSMSACLMQFK